MTSTTSLIPMTESPQTGLLRTDARGRVQRTPEQRERILDEYERSGLSGAKFAALCGVKYQTFAAWVARRKLQAQVHPAPRQPRKATPQVRLLEATVQGAEASGSGLLLEFPAGARAQISHPQHIALAAALLRALEKPC